jgi:hypothetical protein
MSTNRLRTPRRTVPDARDTTSWGAPAEMPARLSFVETDMTETHEPRLFADDDRIVRIGEGLLARDLPRAEWTHEAHLAATTWLLDRRPDFPVDRDLPELIRRYNESVGGVNDASQGYHETITRCFLAGVRLHLAAVDPALNLTGKVNTLLLAPQGRRDWPLRFYSRERLFSIEARLGWIEPDLAPLPGFSGRAGGARVKA